MEEQQQEEEQSQEAAEGHSGSGAGSAEGHEGSTPGEEDEGSEVYSSSGSGTGSTEWDEYWGEEGEEAPLTEQRAMLSFIPDLVADLFVSEQRLARASQSAAVHVLRQAAETGATSRWRAAFGAAARQVAEQQRDQELALLQDFRRTQSATKRGLRMRGPEDGVIK
jgi:hypothetical protein